MKILIIMPSLKVNGGSILFELANHLTSKKHEVKITSLDEIIKVDFFPLIITPQPISELKDFITEADAIIGYYPVCAYYINDLDTKAKKFYFLTDDQRVFYSKEVFKAKYPNIDKDRLEIEYNLQQKYMEKTYMLPLHYLTTNDSFTKTLKNQYKRKTTTIPIGVNIKHYFPELTFLKSNKLRILVEGNLMPWKNVSKINKALSLLHGYELWTLSDTKYTIKSDKHWQNLNSDAIRKVLSSCDILIKAYSEDGTAELQAQAIACGCVVLTSETRGSKMFCKDRINCLTFTNNEEIKDKLELLMKDKQLRNKLITGGLETVKSLNWEESIKTLEKTLKYGKSSL